MRPLRAVSDAQKSRQPTLNRFRRPPAISCDTSEAVPRLPVPAADHKQNTRCTGRNCGVFGRPRVARPCPRSRPPDASARDVAADPDPSGVVVAVLRLARGDARRGQRLRALGATTVCALTVAVRAEGLRAVGEAKASAATRWTGGAGPRLRRPTGSNRARDDRYGISGLAQANVFRGAAIGPAGCGGTPPCDGRAGCRQASARSIRFGGTVVRGTASSARRRALLREPG